MTGEPFLVAVSAGTYHLPFHRLIDWTESWLSRHPEVDAVVQHGTSRPLDGARNVTVMPRSELLDVYSRASVLVLQGGAGGVMDARQLGRVPIVVPRVPVDDEVVDDHQILFAQRLEELGLVRVAMSVSQLHGLLDEAYAGRGPAAATAPVATPGVRAVIEMLEDRGAATRRAGRLRLAADVLRSGRRRRAARA